MGKEQANPAKLVLEGQGLALELYPIVAKDLGAYVGFRGFLYVRMSELEHDLRLARGKPVCIGNAPAQNERVVVQPEVFGIYEQHFPDLEWCVLELLRREFHSAFIGRRPEHLCEIKQAFSRPEPVGSQNQLACEVFDLVKGHTVGIFARLKVWDPSCPGFLDLGFRCASRASFAFGNEMIAVAIMFPTLGHCIVTDHWHTDFATAT